MNNLLSWLLGEVNVTCFICPEHPVIKLEGGFGTKDNPAPEVVKHVNSINSGHHILNKVAIGKEYENLLMLHAYGNRQDTPSVLAHWQTSIQENDGLA